MKAGGRIALGIGAGYLLGRTRKMRLALMIAAAGATGTTSPRQLVRYGLKQLGTSAELGRLTEVARGELVNAAKAAAVSAASSRIDSLTDRLQATAVPGEAVKKTAKAPEATEAAKGRRKQEEQPEPDGAQEDEGEQAREGDDEDEARGGEKEESPAEDGEEAPARPVAPRRTATRTTTRHRRAEEPAEESPARRRATRTGAGPTPVRRTRR